MTTIALDHLANQTQGPASPSFENINTAINAVRAQKDTWVAVGIPARIDILETLVQDVAAVAEQWVWLSCRAKGFSINNPASLEEWLGGPYLVLNNLRLLQQSLRDIKKYGCPQIPGPVKTQSNGQVTAQVFPVHNYHRLLYPGVTAEVWMQPGVTAEQLSQTQAVAYQNKDHPGKVALVLGAGNYSCLGPTDFIYKLFVEDQVVVYKSNPVNNYLDAVLEQAFAVLLKHNFLRIVSGGVEEGVYLSQHPAIDEIHLTGSDKTFEAIVFGPGPAGQRRKAERKPLLHKRITGELGNVSPAIIVPGPWGERDLKYHATHLASMLVVNAGFNCLTTRIIINHATWPQREPLLHKMREQLNHIPPRQAYYTGAKERYHHFLSVHPEAEQFGPSFDGHLPWTLIPNIDPHNINDICFTTEAFCSIFADTVLDAPSVPEYIDRAVDFANNTLWGTLNATLIVHPKSMKNPATAAAVARAVQNLRYGTVALNQWAVVGYGLGSPTWGGFAGHDIYNIQSGIGVVHNTLMFSRPQKSVVRAPFTVWPTPVWFATHKTGHLVGPRLIDFMRAPSLQTLAKLFWPAVRG